MKLDADEKELLESVEPDEWKSAGEGRSERKRSFPYVRPRPQGWAAEHPALEQGPRNDPEAGARRATALSGFDLEPAVQIRVGPP